MEFILKQRMFLIGYKGMIFWSEKNINYITRIVNLKNYRKKDF